ncbi:polyribonucleotide nucleotidyltransferase [Cysteiniphilum sp. QT6929]|uniref:polyribonucleotide nucleotidyltransferase n=1 Tax=Cysteiniphilum sp. QT6929 TaxID=2975055 RepID=UPI0024B39D07|nr:polyribonucleotide nucleotidyltransferase [Cysteiniphilum sp. QT6929]WHN66249.1 polyribonucleotide nucleotidyltransferase [Cysteiniphilum sp. QT6929]
MKIFKEVFQLGQHQVTLETGSMARQAAGSVLVTMGDTVVLVTTAAQKEAKEGIDFFPLTVNYQEKAYAAGKIPGGFPRREGRPSENETLTARLIDRPLRPLFPEGFYNEVQVVATVLSYDPEVPPDIPALIGASASLVLSGVPFEGPVAGVRVGFIDGQYVLNPSFAKLDISELDLVVAGTKDAVLMVESEAKSLPEDVMLGAVLYGHKEMQVIIEAINHLAKYAAKPRWDFVPKAENKALKEQIKSRFYSEIKAVYQETEKQKRVEAINRLRKIVVEAIVADETELEEVSVEEIKTIFHDIEKEVVRKNILSGLPRIDGRDTRTVRPINVRTGVLPKAHGSALFTRGETQALVVTTLGNDRDAQLVETLGGDKKNRYMLHYNFPPYSVGETGMIGTPKRREIGHANLAKRATQAVFPNEDAYPYVIRVVSEITESNGSSSMATVCGSSLSMMDAGVPLAAPVAGIAMGLIKDGDKYAVLSDILGDEDHLGDMDFKVAGTRYGVTALQMDIKIKGITREIMHAALEQAREGRLHILGIMNEVISEYKTETSDNAPQVEVITIDPSKIRDVIGKGGATVKGITEKTGASIDTSDNGDVKIFAKSRDALNAAIEEVLAITASAEVGQTYSGKVVKVLDFGAFINILPGKDGLLPFAELESIGVNPNTMAEGKSMNVMVQNIDRMGKIKLVPVQ